MKEPAVGTRSALLAAVRRAVNPPRIANPSAAATVANATLQTGRLCPEPSLERKDRRAASAISHPLAVAAKRLVHSPPRCAKNRVRARRLRLQMITAFSANGRDLGKAMPIAASTLRKGKRSNTAIHVTVAKIAVSTRVGPGTVALRTFRATSKFSTSVIAVAENATIAPDKSATQSVDAGEKRSFTTTP
jgi:hypothetical protein